jgi:LPXTG-site transpeptidase (sortase) family protein
VDSDIEDALITPDGKMDVPEGSKNVAWFALGPHPGDVGSAVIGGHFGIQDNVPFVFYNLDKLKIGDKVYVVNDRGDTLAFQVRSIELFDRNADATTVFISNDGLAHLNLITCEGIWNQINNTYPERRVVFTDAIPGEGQVVVKVLPAVSFSYQTLRFGAEGADVIALQNFLQQKGFLKILPGAVDGFFGAVTRSAVLKYQASIGLSPDGVFGPLTRAKFILEQSGMAVKSDFPSTGMVIPESNPSSTTQIIIASLKSLYGNLTDGIITSFLLIAIILAILKIIL